MESVILSLMKTYFIFHYKWQMLLKCKTKRHDSAKIHKNNFGFLIQLILRLEDDSLSLTDMIEKLLVVPFYHVFIEYIPVHYYLLSTVRNNKVCND